MEPTGSSPFVRHGKHDGFQIFVGVAESALPHQDGVVVGGMDARRVRQMFSVIWFSFSHLRVGLPRGQLLF